MRVIGGIDFTKLTNILLYILKKLFISQVIQNHININILFDYY